ncbi:MAG TPA: YfiR family protein [Cyclobacteriaceae bacterium]|nr:YfiR family protein [Cyclobacteriaceae bacterium]
MKRFSGTLLLTLFLTGSVFAQQRPIHEVYSMMMFNFIKYVQWPEGGSGEFVIGIVGNADILNTMSTYYKGAKIGMKTIVIKKVQTPTDADDCQVVFIDKTKSSEFDGYNNRAKGKSTLLITDKNGLGEKGSGINFKVVDNKLKFELNQKAIESANLKVANTLSSMAILI